MSLNKFTGISLNSLYFSRFFSDTIIFITYFYSPQIFSPSSCSHYSLSSHHHPSPPITLYTPSLLTTVTTPITKCLQSSVITIHHHHQSPPITITRSTSPHITTHHHTSPHNAPHYSSRLTNITHLNQHCEATSPRIISTTITNKILEGFKLKCLFSGSILTMLFLWVFVACVELMCFVIIRK